MSLFAINHASSLPGYEIRPLRGEFLDPEIERAYRTFSLPRTHLSLHIALALCSALYLACWIADLRVAGFTTPAYYGLACRLVFGISSLILLYVLRRRQKSIAMPVWVACITDFVGSAVYMGLALCIPREIPTLEISTLLVTLSMYVVVPNRLQWTMLFAAAYGATFLVIVCHESGFTVDPVMEALYLISANIACWIFALRQNIVLRADYRSTMQLRERATQDHLRIVLLKQELRRSRAATLEIRSELMKILMPDDGLRKAG